jgi:hypothetical protein
MFKIPELNGKQRYNVVSSQEKQICLGCFRRINDISNNCLPNTKEQCYIGYTNKLILSNE